MVGLADPRIARLDMAGKRLGAPGHQKYDGAYVLSREPDYLVLSAAVLLQLNGPDGAPYREPERVPAAALQPLFRRDFPYLPGDAEIYASGRFIPEYECWIVPIERDQSVVLFKRADKIDLLTGRPRDSPG